MEACLILHSERAIITANHFFVLSFQEDGDEIGMVEVMTGTCLESEMFISCDMCLLLAGMLRCEAIRDDRPLSVHDCSWYLNTATRYSLLSVFGFDCNFIARTSAILWCCQWYEIVAKRAAATIEWIQDCLANVSGMTIAPNAHV